MYKNQTKQLPQTKQKIQTKAIKQQQKIFAKVYNETSVFDTLFVWLSKQPVLILKFGDYFLTMQ